MSWDRVLKKHLPRRRQDHVLGRHRNPQDRDGRAQFPARPPDRHRGQFGCLDRPSRHPALPAGQEQGRPPDPRRARSRCAGRSEVPGWREGETVSLESGTVLWGVQSDVASKMAENRASKYNKNVEEANITMTDWSKSKRPMKRILNLINGSQIKYLVLIARQKDEYETGNNMDAKKTGRVIPEVMKGTEYDVNLALHFTIENGKWGFETSKVQGSLIDLFPLGKKQAKFPFEEFFARFSGIDPSKSTKMRDEDEVTGEIAGAENPHSREELIEFGKELGLSPMDIGATLKDAGITFDPKKWPEMVHLLEDAARATHGNGK